VVPDRDAALATARAAVGPDRSAAVTAATARIPLDEVLDQVGDDVG
jgi:hypothetical protein